MGLIAAIFGRGLLGEMHRHQLPSMLFLAALTIPIGLAMRRAYRGDPDQVRVRVTKAVLYLAAVLFALATVAAPTKWLIPSCIVACVVALVFEGITIAAPSAASNRSRPG